MKPLGSRVNESEVQGRGCWGWVLGGAIPSQTSGHDQGSLWFLIEVEDRGFLRHDSSDHLRASPNCAAKTAKDGKVDDCNVDTKKKGGCQKSGSTL